jgi:uncharacterized phosphosugar-binding protein
MERIIVTTITEYFGELQKCLGALSLQDEAIEAAATVVAATLVGDGLIHVFGTGHSHLLAAEMFYRAGGLGAINPVLVEGLLLHAGAELSTTLERTPGLGRVIFSKLGATDVDTLIVISNSGSNVIARELIACAKENGMTTIALTSVAHATSSLTRTSDEPRIHQLADIVIDNGAAVGDAAIVVPGIDPMMGPTSTVIGAAIVQAISMRAAELAAAAGTVPAVFASSNLAGGDERNRETLARYRSRVRSL